MKRIFLLLCVWAGVGACGDERPEAEAQGSLALSLSSYAGGVEYRLSQAHFTLEGPDPREFSGGDEATIALDLAAGVYRLTLLPGYHLARADDASQKEVAARLVSANPASVTVNAGQTAHLTLRFELTSGQTTAEAGSLAIDLAVEIADAGAPTCSSGLRIDEIDYEQAGTDEAELVEIINPGACPVPLAGVVLELINGGDGKSYSHYDLSSVASTLGAGARLVLGDASVLAALPAGTLALALNGSGLQNGPDGVRLMRADAVLDAVAYEGEVPGFSGPSAPADEGDGALARCAGGEFRLLAPSPGTTNPCDP